MKDEARAIADRLVKEAYWHRGRATWLARPILGKDSSPALVPTLAPLGPSLYGGSAGVALFLWRLGEEPYRATALGAVRHAIHHADAEGPSRFGYHSGALGIAWVARELGFERDAQRIVRTLARKPDAPHHWDLTYGNAGAIPVLLRFPEGEKLARWMGDDLIASARREGDALCWPMPPAAGMQFPKPLAGISHGASGMALGLAHLYRASGDEKYREAALAAFRYERAAFDPATRNWADLRRANEPRPRFQNRWCHGAPGIGMARALAAPLLKEPALLDEIRVAREATLGTLRALLESPGEDLTLCCGMGGLVESLWAMDGNPDAARRVMEHQVARFGRDAQQAWPGFVEWPTMVASGAHPGLMQGVAGMGHLLLRLADPTLSTPLVPGSPKWGE